MNAQDQNGITPIMAAVYGWHHMPDHLSRDVAPDWLMRRLAALLKAMDGVDFSLTEKVRGTKKNRRTDDCVAHQSHFFALISNGQWHKELYKKTI